MLGHGYTMQSTTPISKVSLHKWRLAIGTEMEISTSLWTCVARDSLILGFYSGDSKCVVSDSTIQMHQH